jgi:hypothetical protein
MGSPRGDPTVAGPPIIRGRRKGVFSRFAESKWRGELVETTSLGRTTEWSRSTALDSLSRVRVLSAVEKSRKAAPPRLPVRFGWPFPPRRGGSLVATSQPERSSPDLALALPRLPRPRLRDHDFVVHDFADLDTGPGRPLRGGRGHEAVVSPSRRREGMQVLGPHDGRVHRTIDLTRQGGSLDREELCAGRPH